MSTPSIQTPEPAPFFPLDVGEVGQQAAEADLTSFGLSDQDFLSRFPGLVAGRNQVIDDTYKQLTGPLDPTLQSSFVNEGLAKAFNAFGSGSPSANVGSSGSVGKSAIASSFGQNVQGLQDYYRSELSNQLAQNLPRAIGLSGSDAANLSIANTGNLNASNQAAYAGAVSTQNAQNAADAATTNAAIGTAVSVAGVIIASIA